MANCREKRQSQRSRLPADMYYTFFNSDRFYDCTPLNGSSGGVCFQTGYAIQPGTEIMVFLEDQTPNEMTQRRAKGIRARVRWCNTLPDASAFFYYIGAAYV